MNFAAKMIKQGYEQQQALSKMEDAQLARSLIKQKFAELHGLLKAQSETLALSEDELRYINPDLNGLDDLESDILSTLDDYEEAAREERLQ